MLAPSSTPEAPASTDWTPNPGPQSRFLASKADEVLYGGAAGGGKSSGLIALPTRWVHNPHFRALIVRRETTQLGDLLDKAADLYPRAFPGTRWKTTGAGVVYTFPSGASIWFNHCQRDKDIAKYDGFEFQVIEPDELTHFSRKQYLALRARLRSPHEGLPRYMRSTTNPGGDGHEWVFVRWGPWLDPDFRAEGLAVRRNEAGEKLPPARPGQVLYYIANDRGEGERWVPKGTPGALSRVFIPALPTDNPHLLDHDPDYLARLNDLDRVRREQLIRGNWLIRDAPGELFQRGWFETVPAAPVECMRVRVWDRAATEPNPQNPDPDWTAGVRLALDHDGLYYLEDIRRGRWRPHGVMKEVLATAELDGTDLLIGIIRDPAQAGKMEAATYVSALAGWPVKAWEEKGDKVTRARPLSAQAEAKNVKLVRGPWNAAFLAEAEQFPGGKRDQIDALSMAFNQLTAAAARCGWVKRRLPGTEEPPEAR